MKILIHSPAFLPHIGGLEINTATLAKSLAARGHAVTVWTTTEAGAENTDQTVAFLYRVVRNPSVRTALRLVRDCQVFLHQNLSLRGLWPLLFVRRPWVVSHHSWYYRSDGRLAWQDRLKRFVLRYADASISVSPSVAGDLATPSIVVTNSYRDHLFRRLNSIARDRDLVFVGRLVSDKGVDVLLDALQRLGEAAPRLTVIGDGPERAALEIQTRNLGLNDRVSFLGIRTREDLVQLLNQHRILVVPSRYREPFGIVALEGIACGCAVIGTLGGGLPEAIGPCGLLVEREDPEALAGAISTLTNESILRERLLASAPEHLARHTVDVVTREYEAILRRAADLEGANG